MAGKPGNGAGPVPAADGQAIGHCEPIESDLVRADIQQIMEGGVDAFVRRERKSNNELNGYRAALHQLSQSES